VPKKTQPMRKSLAEIMCKAQTSPGYQVIYARHSGFIPEVVFVSVDDDPETPLDMNGTLLCDPANIKETFGRVVEYLIKTVSEKQGGVKLQPVSIAVFTDTYSYSPGTIEFVIEIEVIHGPCSKFTTSVPRCDRVNFTRVPLVVDLDFGNRLDMIFTR
jgi:hypothetical protein